MDHRITQCPRCGTSFRVTEAQLAVAAGAVRCGSCLHIFNAREHWLEEKTAPAPKVEAPLRTQQIEDFEIDDDAVFDDDTPLFDDEEPTAKTSGGSIFNPIDDDFAVIDDGSPEKITASFSELNSWEQDTGASFGRAHEREHEDIDRPSDEAWTKKLLEEPEPDLNAIQAPARARVFEDFGDILEQVPETEGHDDDDEEFIDIDAELNALASSERPKPTTATSDDAVAESIEPESLHALDRNGENTQNPLFSLSGFDPEPLQLHQFVRESRWPKILWGFGLVAALALLAGQYVYFNFNTLARSDLRPWLAKVCTILTCSLPSQSDIGLIRTGSLIVRSHPTHRGALAIDAILTNLAPFTQPYPPLLLQFTDLNGAPVAGREFTPAEYLSGELSGSHLMPTQQPIHIALEIVDPGPRAVNYSLTVAQP